MWIITSVNTGEVFHLLKEQPKHVVGRAGADIILKDDTSISRAHAVLQFETGSKDLNSLILIDTESKYGTYHNDGIASNSKISPNESIQLHDGDRIRFGLLKNEWKLAKFDIKCMSSALLNAAAKSLEQYINALGGSIIPRWEPSCTHLTMDELTVTVKLLYALLNNIPIVTSEYWKDVLNSARKNQISLPRAKNYIPRKSVMLVNKHELDFSFRPERKSLFSDKTIVFMHKTHFDTYGPIIEQAGGIIKDLNSGVQKTLLIKPNVIVIQYVPSTQSQSSQTIDSINDLLQSNSKRIIPEYEIGLAIVLCSVEKYCNPDYKNLTELMPATEAAHSDLEIPETDQTTPSLNSSASALSAVRSLEVDGHSATDEAMPNLAVSPSMNIESESKRKRLATSNDNDADSDGDFSHQPKKPNLQKDEAYRPLPIIIQQKKSTIGCWLNKTQTQSSQKDVEASTANCDEQAPQATKRGRIAVINDDDSGDENDLFNFGASGSASGAKKMRVDNDFDKKKDDSDEMFSFPKPPTEKAFDADSEVLDATQEFVAKDKPQNNTVVPVKRKIIPQKVSTEGWLCCSFNHLNVDQIKTEIKSEIKTEDMTEQKQYIDSLKGGFEVRIGAIKICYRENDSSCNANNLSNAINSTTKNFKPFVKKCNYIPQKNVISVVRVPVEPLRRI